jgi:hypothetical protein
VKELLTSRYSRTKEIFERRILDECIE